MILPDGVTEHDLRCAIRDLPYDARVGHVIFFRKPVVFNLYVDIWDHEEGLRQMTESQISVLITAEIFDYLAGLAPEPPCPGCGLPPVVCDCATKALDET